MQIVGIDPGIVHTGMVLISMDPGQHIIEVSHEVIAGVDTTRAQQFLGGYRPTAPVFIEGYRQRSNYGTNDRMIQAVAAYRQAFPRSKVIQNTGVKQVVRRPLMELLGVWKFSTPTHHQDLRSAARIAIYGALKQDTYNELIYTIVRDHLDGHTWSVIHN